MRWFFLCPVLVIGGFNMMSFGSPIPLWQLERLKEPVMVRSVSESQLVLENGGTIKLPAIKKLPYDNQLFHAAINDGVEIRPDGQIYGLIWFDRACGNDPVVWRRLRVNLSDLTGALHPAGIDDSFVPPDAIAFLQENSKIELSQSSRSHQKGHFTLWDRQKMQMVREQFERSSTTAASAEAGDGDRY